MATPSAVTFDFWNTLVVEPKGLLATLRRQAVTRALREHDAMLDEGALSRHLDAVRAAHERAWHSGVPYQPVQAANSFADAIGTLSVASRSSIVDAYLRAGESAELEPVPNAAKTVRALSAAGVRLGIVCDVGLTGSSVLRGFLERRELLQYFDGWAFSDEVGYFKPSQLIFRQILDQLAIPPGGEIWHVGDLRRTDVAGARAAGIVPVRFRGVVDDCSGLPDADYVIDDLTKLIGDLKDR